MLYSSTYKSPFGKLSIVCDNNSLHGIWFENQKYFQASLTEIPIINELHPYSLVVKSWLSHYFNGERPAIDELILSPNVTNFRKRVLTILQEIPYGETISYKEIGQAMTNSPMSAQAIGGAVGHNPIAIVIPCHRVVGTNGNLTGYAAGINTKIKLLAHERVNLDNLFISNQKGL